MALGSMSYEDARARASELTTSATKIDELFDQLKIEMNSLEEVIKSNGADSLYQAWKTLEPKLDGYPSKIRDFSAFLNKAVEAYEQNDRALGKEV